MKDPLPPPYRRNFPITWESCALLVVDMQNDFVHPDGAFPIANLANPLALQIDLVHHFRRKGLPLIFTRHVTDPNTNPIEMLIFKHGENGHLNQDSWGWAICQQLTPEPGETIIDKRRFDAFLDTPLTAILTKHQITDLVICGCQTHICCDTTARSAANRDYRVTMAGDACATRYPDFQHSTLQVFAQAFGQALPTETIIAESP